MQSKLHWILSEWKHIVKNPGLLVPLLGLLIIPVLYCGTYLWAFWDPYGHLEKLPVAVVNMDQGASRDGKTYALGADLVRELREDRSFDWHFVGTEEAAEGLKENKYYILIQVPPNFSSRAVTLSGHDPQPLELLYTANPGYNYIAARIGESGITKIREQLSRMLIESYTKELFTGINASAKGLGEAAAGAARLKEGALKLSEGSGKLTAGMAGQLPELRKLQSGAAELSTRLGDAAAGAERLGAAGAELGRGAAALRSGAGQLAQGARQLGPGTRALVEGTAAFNGGLARLGQGSEALLGSFGDLQQGAGTAAGGAAALLEQLQRYASAHSEAAGDAEFKRLLEASRQLAAGTKALETGADRFAGGLKEADSGLGTLTAKFGALRDGAAELSAAQGKLQQGAETLETGLDKLQTGTAEFQKGTYRLTSGLNQLAAGSKQISTGVSSAVAGWSTIADKVATLNEGQTELAAGAEKLSTSLAEGARKAGSVVGTQHLYNTLANPVRVQERNIHDVPNYGTALAPYFLSLSLYVGSLLLATVFPVRSTVLKPVSPISWFISKYAIFLLVGGVQAAIASIFLMDGLGLQKTDPQKLVWFAILTSACYMAIIQFLVTVFGNVGKFLGIVLLVLQLTSTAGTYPVELIPDILQNLHPFLPMTYSLNGFREIISTGNLSHLHWDAAALAGFGLACVLGSLLYFLIRYRRIRSEIVPVADEHV
ncbi:YhgE/Pip family protein [Paenibacillus gansuensis]|uniref:YhgE/Pip family protein n=1 Tax=Paenibacillus gansuensis TaxID=306542 RepID=A0ABW5PJ42_9BACL